MTKIIIYQVLPRLFGNTNRTRKFNGSYEENGCGKLNDFTPKALEKIKQLGTTHIWYTGVIEHALQTDYSHFGISKDFPEVVKGKAGSPYAIKDYYDINPDLAEDVPNRMQEFEALINRTQESGLKTIIDFVPNHLARQYNSDAKPKDTKEFGEADNTDTNFNANNNFYYLPTEPFSSPISGINEHEHYIEKPAKVTGNDCMSNKPTINDWYETIKLNYGVDIFNGNSKHFEPIPNTWERMLEILLFWANKKVDGFRCDMAEMVPVEFWHWVIPKVKDKYPHIIFIAEVYNPDLYRQFITHGGFDFLYDKVGVYDSLKAVMQGHAKPNSITKAWDSVTGIQQHMLFFLENHDEQRIASPFFAGDAKKGIPAMIVSGCMYTNPLMLYFGQELGEAGMDKEGFSGEDGRTTIFDYWGVEQYQNWVNDKKFDGGLLSDAAADLRAWHIHFINTIKNHEAITQGQLYDLMWYNEDNPSFDGDKIFAFLRYFKGKILLIVVNFSDEKLKCRVKIPAHAFFSMGMESKKYFKGIDLLGGENIISFPQEVAITNGAGLRLKPYSGRIYELS
ncbi:alpha-amylase family glycosyl hydrolase [Saccharicrinis aurantiacus]|uniref:alpha-amylase family glycosyl hydrolase n=1 Tax=Saccharicrinis aurantiacus TaxID=1849719 RepID=UPI00249185A7|nr:alpha-amylase family glycosyl hydrolase [Saccharicrinis aurantiacus]